MPDCADELADQRRADARYAAWNLKQVREDWFFLGWLFGVVCGALFVLLLLCFAPSMFGG